MPESKHFIIQWVKGSIAPEVEIIFKTSQDIRDRSLYLNKEQLDDLQYVIYRTKIEFFSGA